MSWRVLRLPSLAEDLEEVLIPVDRGERVLPAVPSPAMGRRCFRCGALMRRVALIVGWGWHCDDCRAWQPEL